MVSEKQKKEKTQQQTQRTKVNVELQNVLVLRSMCMSPIVFSLLLINWF